MTNPFAHWKVAGLSSRIVQRHRAIFRALIRRRIIGFAMLASLLATIYWSFIASDLYVSEAHVVIQRTDVSNPPTPDFSGLLGGGGSSRLDQLFLRDHMLSVDMLKVLDAKLDLRSHYSDHHHDLLSRMWSRDASMERFHRYFQSRVSVEFDELDGVLTVRAQGYSPRVAHEIAVTLLQEGGAFMNAMARSLAQEQVSFLEKQVAQLHRRAVSTREAVVAYQNKEGLVSPQATAESINALVARLESQRAELQTRRNAALAYLVADHPDVVQLNQQVAAVEKQIATEQAKLASPMGNRLNRTIEEYQRLESEAAFAQELYKGAMMSLEKGRIDSTRTVKMVSVLQMPTQPEYPLEPRRFYNALVFMLMALLVAGVVHLLAAIVRDHKD